MKRLGTHLMDLYCFELGDEFKVLAEMKHAMFYDDNDDGIVEIAQTDRNFSYWYVDGASSPYPSLLLSFKDGEFKPDINLMRKREITPYNKMVSRVENAVNEYDDNADVFWKKNNAVVLPPVLWYLTEFLYAGRIDDTRDFLDDVWKYDDESKNAYWADFMEQLKKSEFWGIIEQVMNFED